MESSDSGAVAFEDLSSAHSDTVTNKARLFPNVLYNSVESHCVCSIVGGFLANELFDEL